MTEIGATQRLSLNDATWCPSCGALVAAGATTCPSCGAQLMPPDSAPARKTRDIDLPDIGHTGAMDALDAAEAARAAQIESAIPPPSDVASAEQLHDEIRHVRGYVVAAVLAVLVVGGAALLITHPWDPTATRTAATEPADTSMQGFPGTVETLSGQDKTSSGSEGDDQEASETDDVFSQLSQAYETLGELSSAVSQNQRTLLTDGVSSTDLAAREAGQTELTSLSIQVSNLITQLQALEAQTTVYADQAGELVTLGNWLRNRCDALSSAWELSVSADDPASVSDAITSKASASVEYGQLFSDAYAGAEPVEANE